MNKQVLAVCLAVTAMLPACGGGGSTGGTLPGNGGNGGGNGPSGVGPLTIGFALPDGTIGTVNTPPFGVVGGYTQSVYSQTLAFPPGTVLKLQNLSSSTPHTLNVLSTTAFPVSPALSTAASGGSTLAMGYASGAIAPGSSVSVTLGAAGTYYIGCGFHYNDAVSMRDVIQVASNATPGPQATPQPDTGGGIGGGKY